MPVLGPRPQPPNWSPASVLPHSQNVVLCRQVPTWEWLPPVGPMQFAWPLGLLRAYLRYLYSHLPSSSPCSLCSHHTGLLHTPWKYRTPPCSSAFAPAVSLSWNALLRWPQDSLPHFPYTKSLISAQHQIRVAFPHLSKEVASAPTQAIPSPAHFSP